MIEFLDPRGAPGTPIEPYQLRIDLDRPVAIGLLANGFPDSVRFLDQVERALGAAHPGATFHRFDKGDASSIVSDAMLDDLVDRCQAVVAAYGH
jgi:hypothetical protein